MGTVIALAPEWLEDAAFHASKKNQTSASKKRSPKAEKKERVPASAGKKNQFSDARGLDAYLALIGDGEGQDGFNAPIFSALCSYFATNGSDAPMKPVLERIEQAVAEAERDQKRDRSKYEDEDYLIEQAEKARDFIQGQIGAAPEAITDFSEDGIKAALADASLTDDGAIRAFMRRCLDGGADIVARGDIIHEIAQLVKVTKPELKKMWTKVEKEKTKQDRDPQRARKAGERFAIYTPGNFRSNCDGLYEFLQDQSEGPSLFHSNGRLVDVQEDEDGNIRIAAFEKDRFKASVLEERADFYKVNKDGDETEIEAPSGIVNNVFHKPRTVYPPLTRVIGVPTFVADDGLMDVPGYHASGLFYHPKPAIASMPRVSGSPSRDDARNSVFSWADLVADFCLDGVTDRDEFIAMVMDGENVPSFCNVISAGLGPIMREQIPGPLPVTLFRKDKPRTGASLLATVVQRASTLENVAATALPTNSEEMQKVITTFFESGAPNLYIDNLPRNIDSGVLAGAATAYPNYLGRRLGRTEFVNVAARGQILCTGNRVALSEELAPRTQLITLDPEMPQPENRKGFKYPTITQHVEQNLGDYLHALLTIGQYWNSDRILWNGDALGGFEVHNQIMGRVLDALGVNGYLTNRETLKAVNAIGEEEEMMDLLIGYHLEEMDDKPGTVFRVMGSQNPPEGHEFENHRVVSIRDVLDTNGIPLDGSNYTVDENGGVHYSDKAKKKLPQVIAGLAAKGGVGGLVREWDELVDEDTARQGRYYLESAGSDRHSTLYKVVHLPNPNPEGG